MFSKYIYLLMPLWALACGRRPDTLEQAPVKWASQSTLELPRLLERPEALRYGKEWDDVQNFYGAQCAALRSNPNHSEARLLLAECFMQEARVTGEHPHYYPAALSMIEPVIVQLTNKKDQNIQEKDLLFRALSHKASIQLSLHDFVAAKNTAAQAVAINPYNAYIYGCLVDAHVELGAYEEAVALCDKMVSIRPDLRSYARVSYLREIHGDPKGAIEAMKMAVAAGYPGYEQTEWARLQLGGLLEKYGQEREAQTQYENTLALRPNYPFAQAALAGLEWKKGKWQSAIERLKAAAEIVPEVGFYIDMAKIYRQKGDQKAFELLANEIESMFKEDMEAGHNMRMEAARFQLELRQNPEKALELLQEELNSRASNKDVNQLLGEIYLQQGNKKAAAEALQKAAATGSKDPDLKRLLSRL